MDEALPRDRKQRLIMTWDTVEKLSQRLYDQLAEQPFRREIIPISRGGLVVASLLAYKLGVKIRSLITLDEISQCFFLSPDPTGGGDGNLIVDDICDSGATLTRVRECYPRAKVAVLCAQEHAPVLWDYIGCQVSSDTWVTFPWAPEDK